MQVDGFVNLFVEFAASLYVMRSEPTADAFVLKIRVDTVSKILIPGRVADEATVKLDCSSQ